MTLARLHRLFLGRDNARTLVLAGFCRSSNFTAHFHTTPPVLDVFPLSTGLSSTPRHERSFLSIAGKQPIQSP